MDVLGSGLAVDTTGSLGSGAPLCAIAGVLSGLAPASITCGARTCGDVPLRGFQDGQHRHGAAEELESAAIGGNVLVEAGARAEEVTELIVSPAEPGGRSGAFEAPHGPVAAFDAAVVLLQPVVQIATGPVPYAFAQRG